MDRRDVLRALGTLAVASTGAGCLGSPGGTTGSVTPGATNDPTTTTEPASTTSRAPCSTVETEFEVPDLAKPDPLTAEAAEDVAWKIEDAYWEAIDYSPRSLAPEDADYFSFYRGFPTGETVYEGPDGYTVPLGGRVSYGYDGAETGETQKDVDKPVRIATYFVSTRRVSRTAGVDLLTGTVVCW